jgi:TRAP-type mannitol/chloroaromatic compound transport system substrate-binding protein
MNRFIDNVKQRTNGKLIIKGYSANQLVKVMGVFDAVSKGAIEMGWGTGIYHESKIPEAAIEFGLPFSWETWEEQKEVYHKYGLMEKVRQAYAAKGIYFLSPHPAGPYLLMTKKRLNSIEDMKGLKLRTHGLTAKIVELCGAATVAVPGVEQYMALQRGTIDGTVYVTLALTAQKLNEVVNFVYYPGFLKPTTDLYVNLQAWNGLSPDLQKALQESIDVMLEDMDKGYDQEDALGLMNSLIAGRLKGALRFSDEDVAKLRAMGVKVADEVATKTPLCKEMVDIVKKFLKDKGKI